jgi:hypothetical protein
VLDDWSGRNRVATLQLSSGRGIGAF